MTDDASRGAADADADRMGTIDAELRGTGRDDRAVVLERHGLTAEGYAEAKSTLRAAIDRQLAAGESGAVVAYAAAFRRALAAAPPLAPPPTPEGQVAAHDPAAPPPVDIPTYLARTPLIVGPTALGAPRDVLDSTLEARLSVTPRSLPFVAAGPVHLPLAPPDREGPLATRPRAEGDLDATSEIDARVTGRAVLPFAKNDVAKIDAPGAAEVDLTLEQYASLCAELAATAVETHGARAAAYGFGDEASLGALHGRWRRRFELDSALHARWVELRTAYAGWLARR